MRAITLTVFGILACGAALAADDAPAHPRDLRYPPLRFDAPNPADFRVVLPNGLVCYLVPDRGLPTIHVSARLRTGELYVAKERRGLAKLVGALLRDGGSGDLDARELDRRLDRIASEITSSFALDRGEAKLWTLSAHADESLGLFADVLRRPRFDGDRIRRAKDDLKEEVAHRDDDPHNLLERRYAQAIYGDHAAAWEETEQTIDAVTRDELVAFHRRWVRPETVILSVAGDFDRAGMEKKLAALFGDWKGEGPAPELAVAPPTAKPHAGVTVIDKEVNQGFLQMGHPTVALGHPDCYALQVMDYILGDGSFTSRVTSRVRNDEGLAYSAGSFFSPGRLFPGTIGLYFQSKVETVAFATKICLEEARRIRETPVAPEELARAKDALTDRFPEMFVTSRATADTLAENEFLGRPADYLAHYREKVAAVSAADVQRVARAHLRPEDLAIVVVGPAERVKARDEKHACALGDFEPAGKPQ
jgi:predicted Zn-dependent peptidase